MKKNFLLILLSFAFIGGVNAQGIFYENSNGVILTQKEYRAISDFYWDGYQKNLSLDEYNFLKNNGLFENEIKTVQISDSNYNLLSEAEHTTANKSLKMSMSCNTNCLVSITLRWINLPKIRSYDILGIYLDGASPIQVNKVRVDTNKGKSEYSYDKKENIGIGTSFKLPTDVTYLDVSQLLLLENKGSIKASYQHARKTITSVNSKKYSFSKSGIGGVFKFNTGIQDYYDCMVGVELKTP